MKITQINQKEYSCQVKPSMFKKILEYNPSEIIVYIIIFIIIQYYGNV